MKNRSLVKLCFLWLVRKDQLIILLLLVCVLLSSFGVIYASYLTRQLYAELQQLEAREDEIDSDYGKLLLEHSAFANYARVEQVSKEQLNMISPLTEDMVLVGK